MKVRYGLCDPDGNFLFCNLQQNDISQLENVDKRSQLFGRGAHQMRCGVIASDCGKVYAFTNSDDYIKSSKSFVAVLEAFGGTLRTFKDVVTAHQEKVNTDTNRLLHNLITLNAHNIQEVYSLVSQETLSKVKPNEQVAVVESIVKTESRDVAFALLRIAKNNAAMKAEFSVFRKLFESSPRLEKKSHNVHKVLMNILYLFFPDFTDKEVLVDITCANNVVAFFDYESVHVALYHLIENSVKYVKPKTHFGISITEVERSVEIIFSMTSLRITDAEKELIFTEGYSCDIAKKIGKSGSGIGMTQARRILEINGATIRVEVDPKTLHEHFGVPYQNNSFKIVLSTKNNMFEYQ